MAQLNFRELKDRVSVIQVALELGYTLDRSKGNTQPSFVLKGGDGSVQDRIYVKNPKNPSIQGYWRRDNGINSKGDVIGFVKENLNSFPEAHGARNEIDAINKVLNRMAGNPLDLEDLVSKASYFDRIVHNKPFDINRYSREKDNIGQMMNFFRKRGISLETVEKFSPFLELIVDNESQKKYKNLAFPYRNPDDMEKIVGYEVRGFSGFKGKAEGSNSTTGMWIADFTQGNPDKAKYIFFAESAFDAMSFQQLHNSKLKLEECVFISVGGSFSDQQYLGAVKSFPQSRSVLLFDNDTNGRMYDIRAYALAKGIDLRTSIDKASGNVIIDIKDKGKFQIPVESVSLESFFQTTGFRQSQEIALRKAPAPNKDWNEVLQSRIPKEDMNTKYDYNNSFKR